MKFLIMGAGAIGSVIGGFLAKAGHDVSLVGREEHIKSIAKKGLRIDGIWGEHLIPSKRFKNLLTTTGPDHFDYVLLTVKSYDTETASEQLRSTLRNYLERGSPLFVSMQNGIGNIEIIAKKLGTINVAGARVIFGAKIIQPGSVRVTVIAEPTLFGPGKSNSSRNLKQNLKYLADAMNSSGIPSKYVDDVRPYLWAKVFYNSALNPLSAVLQKSYGDLAKNPFARSIMNRAIEEAFCVAKKLNIKLFWRSSNQYKKYFYNKLIPPTSSHYASMLEDLKRKKTEIDAINGAIVRYAKRLGIPVPVNEALTNLLKAHCE